MKKKLIAKRRTVAAAYTVEAAAEISGVQPGLIRYFQSRGIFATVTTTRGGEPVLDDSAIYELRRIEHFRRRYGANRGALEFIHGLLREVERLEAELRSRAYR
jgi:hypothetical protein